MGCALKFIYKYRAQFGVSGVCGGTQMVSRRRDYIYTQLTAQYGIFKEFIISN